METPAIETGSYTIRFGYNAEGHPVSTYEKSDGVTDEQLIGALTLGLERAVQRALDGVTDENEDEPDA